MPITNSTEIPLATQFDSCKSFYGKATMRARGSAVDLLSYGSHVATVEGETVTLLQLWDYSPTTLRHVKEFLKQSGFRADSVAQMRKAYA